MEARLHRLQRIILHRVPSTLQQRADTTVCECPATVQDWLQLGRRDESCDGLQSAISETSGIWPPTCAAVCWSGVGRGFEGRPCEGAWDSIDQQSIFTYLASIPLFLWDSEDYDVSI